MEEYLKQEQEERLRYQEYISRRRQEIESKQAPVLDQLKQDLAEKHTLKQKIEHFEVQHK